MAEERGEKPQDKVAVFTSYPSAMPDVLARARGFEMRRVLTGFGHIGDQIDQPAMPPVRGSLPHGL